MKNKILKNLQLNLFITVCIGVLGFVVNKYFSEYMGMENLGLMRLFSQLIAYLSLADLGLASASTYVLYKPLLEKDYKKLNIIVSTITSFYKKIAGFILIIGLVLNFAVPYFFKTNIDGKVIYLYWSMYVLNTTIGYVFAKYPIVFTANQEYGFVRTIQGIGKIVFQIFQITILVYTQSFILFILMMILENIFLYYFYNRHYKKYYSYIETVEERDKEIIKGVKNLFWHKVGGIIVYNTDYIVLSKFTSLSIIAIYSSYLIIYQVILTIVNVVNPVISPHIGQFIVKHNKDEIYLFWKRLYTLYMIMGSTLIFISYKVINPFVELWLGEKFVLSKITVFLIMINLFIQITRGVTDIFKDNSGFFDDTYAPALESIINLAISIILVQKMGLNGVIIGTIVSNILIIYLLKPILVFRRCFDKEGKEYIKILIKNLFFVGISFSILEILINKISYLLKFSNWTEWIISSGIITSITGIITLIIFMLNKNFRELLSAGLKRMNLKS